MADQLFTEKYRPSSFTDMIGHSQIRDFLKRMIDKKSYHNIILYGEPGSGKTSIIKCLINYINTTNPMNCDYCEINASDDRSIKTFSRKISTFMSNENVNKIRILVLEEIDSLMTASQILLLSYLIDPIENCIIICTCNHIMSVIEELKHRMLAFEMHVPNIQEISEYLCKICQIENINYEPTAMIKLVDECRCDTRRCLNIINYAHMTNSSVNEQMLHIFFPHHFENMTLDELYMHGYTSYEIVKYIYDQALEHKKYLIVLMAGDLIQNILVRGYGKMHVYQLVNYLHASAPPS